MNKVRTRLIRVNRGYILRRRANGEYVFAGRGNRIY